MPALGVMIMFIQIQLLGNEFIAQAVAMGLFFISLPIQGLLWLGHRSNQDLPPQIFAWYKEVYAKMQAQGCELQAVKAKPKFKELALLLRTAFKELDKAFTKNLF